MTRPIRMHSLFALTALLGASAPTNATTRQRISAGAGPRPGARLASRLPNDARFNGRGDYLSPKGELRRQFAPMSGRQWVRLRRAIRQAQAGAA